MAIHPDGFAKQLYSETDLGCFILCDVPIMCWLIFCDLRFLLGLLDFVV